MPLEGTTLVDGPMDADSQKLLPVRSKGQIHSQIVLI